MYFKLGMNKEIFVQMLRRFEMIRELSFKKIVSILNKKEHNNRERNFET